MEVLVTLGIFALVMALALGVGFDTLVRSNAQTERDLMVHLLQKARARAMANMYESGHTFESDGVNYTLSYTESDGNLVEERTPIGKGVSVSDSITTFSQLSGNTQASSSISISANSLTYIVKVDTNGRISW